MNLIGKVILLVSELYSVRLNWKKKNLIEYTIRIQIDTIYDTSLPYNLQYIKREAYYMMRKKHIALLTFSVLLLTGCADAPGEVKEEIKNYENADAVQETEIIMIPFPEAIQQADQFHESNTTNISVDHLIIPESTKMPTYRVDFYNEKGAELFTKLQSEPLFGNDGTGTVIETENGTDEWLSNKEYCFTAFPELGGTNYYRNASGVMISDWGVYFGQNMRMTESGCFTFYCDEERTGISSYSNYPVVRRFYSNFEQEKETYTLYDGASESVAEAVKLAEDFCNNNLKESEDNRFNYQVNYVDVRDIGNDKYGYYVSLCRKDLYGNYFDATPNYPFRYEEFSERNALIASPIYMWITSSDSISEFERYYTFSLEETNANENIVSLECAIDLLSATLAQGKSYAFDTAELKYILEIMQSDYIDSVREYVRTEGNEDIISAIVYSPDSVYAYGDYEITAIPYWVFTDITAQNTNTNCGAIYMVNALDGSLRIENVNEYGNVQIQY